MKIVVFGGMGTIGRAVVAELGERHEVMAVSRRSGTHCADMTDPASIDALLQSIGKVDALVSCAGRAAFAPLRQMTRDALDVGLQSKLMGQVNVILAGLSHLNDGGSITLVSGVLTEQYVRDCAPVALANGALEAFARAAAIDMPRGLRVNVVSPGVVQESVAIHGKTLGFEPVPASRVALAYARSVEGTETGQIYRAWSTSS